MSPTRTFADLIALAKADQALSDSRRRHVVSDLKCFLREAGRQPAAVPATVAGARELIQAMRQRPLGRHAQALVQHPRQRQLRARPLLRRARAALGGRPRAAGPLAGAARPDHHRPGYPHPALAAVPLLRAARHRPRPGVRGDVRGVPRLAGAADHGDRPGRAVPPHLPGLEPRRRRRARLAADPARRSSPAAPSSTPRRRPSRPRSGPRSRNGARCSPAMTCLPRKRPSGPCGRPASSTWSAPSTGSPPA